MLLTILLVIAAILFLFFLGPRPKVRTPAAYDASILDADPDAALAAAEARYNDIRDGLQKEIIWRDPETRNRTPISIVYVHGFSAAKPETRPLPDMVAEALDANLFYTRLSGHGRTSEAMAEPEAADWLADVTEALAVGRRIGEQVLVIATSTGATTAAWAALQPEVARQVAGLAFISPNFGIRDRRSDLLTIPWGNRLVRRLVGTEYDGTTGNPDYDTNWTPRYPSIALLPMIALVQHVRRLPFEKADIPLMVLHAPEDQVVSPVQTRKVFDRWGGPKTWIDVHGTAGPTHHVIAGDVVNPEKTRPLAQDIIDWARSLD